jgi:hypothetical protein
LLTCNIGWMATRSYAKAIEDTWLRRQLIEVSEEMANAAYGGDDVVVGQDARIMLDNACKGAAAQKARLRPRAGCDCPRASAPARCLAGYVTIPSLLETLVLHTADIRADRLAWLL